MADGTDAQMTPEREAAQREVREMRARLTELGEDGLDLLFRKARSHYAWSDRPVPQAVLERLYATIRAMPTSGNGNPARFVFVTSPEAKARLLPCINPGNVAKMTGAPVTVIVAHDLEFWRELPKLHPHRPNVEAFRDNPERAARDAFRNATLQGAYMMLAARALGLDVGPMSGFAADKVDAEFFAGTSLRSNFLCNIGYGDESALFQRLPRLEFGEACQIL
jgi:3-hydroxypropanoate dehydrogenase